MSKLSILLAISTLDEPTDDNDDEEQYENELTSTIIINANILIRVVDDEPLPHNIKGVISEIKFDFIVKINLKMSTFFRSRKKEKSIAISFNKKSKPVLFIGKNDVWLLSGVIMQCLFVSLFKYFRYVKINVIRKKKNSTHKQCSHLCLPLDYYVLMLLYFYNYLYVSCVTFNSLGKYSIVIACKPRLMMRQMLNQDF